MRELAYLNKGITISLTDRRIKDCLLYTSDLDNDDIISMVETTPTFQRTNTVLESIPSKACLLYTSRCV